MQHKSLDLTQCDVKFAKDEEGSFEGYLSIFGSVDSYGDTVIKGAYEETLMNRKRMPPMLLNHDQFSVPIGIWQEMKEDDTGLRVKGQLTPGNSQAEQVYAAMKHGAMTGMSIGYRPTKYEENDHGGLDLIKIELREGSVVTMPAEDDARIDVVKFEEEFSSIESVKDFEYALRDAGLSRKLAKSMVSQFKDVCLRDAGDLQQKITELEAELDRFKRVEYSRARMTRLEQLVNGD